MSPLWDSNGSSPLARGLPLTAGYSESYGGIIPARAGFTMTQSPSALASGDHPRSRGVYVLMMVLVFCVHGSSPLARGLLVPKGVFGAEDGIIPARAGFTSTSTRAQRSWWDHPRSRGVYDRAWDDEGWAAGSSPLARGLPVLNATGKPEPGIIPARAGFTRWNLSWR